MIPLHLGPLHPAEQALTLALAFGPFVLLGIVVAWRRRAERAAEAAEAAEAAHAAGGAASAPAGRPVAERTEPAGPPRD